MSFNRSSQHYHTQKVWTSNWSTLFPFFLNLAPLSQKLRITESVTLWFSFPSGEVMMFDVFLFLRLSWFYPKNEQIFCDIFCDKYQVWLWSLFFSFALFLVALTLLIVFFVAIKNEQSWTFQEQAEMNFLNILRKISSFLGPASLAPSPFLSPSLHLLSSLMLLFGNQSKPDPERGKLFEDVNILRIATAVLCHSLL